MTTKKGIHYAGIFVREKIELVLANEVNHLTVVQPKELVPKESKGTRIMHSDYDNIYAGLIRTL